MFEERQVRNAHLKFQGRVYGAPELRDYEGEAVKVSRSTLFPAAVLIVTGEFSFICLAKNAELWRDMSQQSGRQQVLQSIETMIFQDEIEDGPATMNPYTVDEWLGIIGREMAKSKQHAAYGNTRKSLDRLLQVAKECVKCVDYHIQREAIKGSPELEEAIAELKAADPAGTESAA